MYQHKTFNHLTFDYVRKIQFEVNLLRSYIDDGTPGGEYDDVMKALNRIDTLLFDGVYKPLRDRWKN